MKNWVSMDSTLRIFSKTNSSSCVRNCFNSRSRWLFKVGCGVLYIKKPNCHLNRDLRENGRFRWKIENPCLKNFSGVTSQKLDLGEVEESQGLPEVKHLNSQNGFFTMYSLSLKLFVCVETKIFEFEYFGLEVERSQLVSPKISKWVFSSSLPYAS